MTTIDYLEDRFPALAARLPRLPLTDLPTPVRAHRVLIAGRERTLWVKRDDLTGTVYGGNKLRKLEYILPEARDKRRSRLATFGAVGSNSALATAIYARQAGFDCTCFLMHQSKTPNIAATLNMHLQLGTELVRYGGGYADRLAVLRDYLWGRNAWVIPMGCSSWRGTVGFVAAGLELAAQVDAGELPAPDRIYVGTGTMGTAAGIALGLALAGLDAEVHAVRVSDTAITNEASLDRLLRKTASLMRRLDDTIPADLADRARVRLRNSQFGDGYAKPTPAAEAALDFALEHFELRLETTYTGKALAALLADARDTSPAPLTLLFWNTYCATPVTVPLDRPLDVSALPGEFLRYFE